MEYALFYNCGNLEISLISSSLDSLVFCSSMDKKGNFKFRFPEVGDYFENMGTIIFIGSEKDCIEEKINIIDNAR